MILIRASPGLGGLSNAVTNRLHSRSLRTAKFERELVLPLERFAPFDLTFDFFAIAFLAIVSLSPED
jgi:hypothetical protein